jgi:cytoskeletal protein CcmA (bactofilin family)
VTETALRDLKLLGTTSTSGGFFRKARVTGEAVISGDTHCEKLSCMGNFEVKGSLEANMIKLTGNGKIEGNLHTSQLSVMGELQVSGRARGDRLKIIGDLRVTGDCEAESMELSGGFEIGGMLHAEKISVKIHARCKTQEIGAGTITVKRSRAAALKQMFGSWKSADLTADLIEGDTVYLEYTRASVVRGNRVKLGAGCEIGRVEYRTELQEAKNIVVGERIRL